LNQDKTPNGEGGGAAFRGNGYSEGELHPVVNFDHFVECFRGDAELETEIIEIFFKTGMESICVLENAIKTGDADMIASEAHKLKGSCLALGAEPLARVCETIQTTAHCENVKCLSPFVELARVNFAALHDTLVARTHELSVRSIKKAA
jgi:HPt (histidine-containing phosphotransfer) domain-containing protein